MPKPSCKPPVILVGIVALCFALPAYSEDAAADFSFMTLNGLSTVAVLVKGIHRDFERYGLESDVVKSSVEAKLKENRIAVVGLDDAKHLPNASLIEIKLTTNEDRTRLYFYGLSLAVEHKVPINDAGGFVSRRIWSRGKTGLVDPSDLGRMNGHIADLLALFLQDYHDQNRQASPATD